MVPGGYHSTTSLGFDMEECDSHIGKPELVFLWRELLRWAERKGIRNTQIIDDNTVKWRFTWK